MCTCPQQPLPSFTKIRPAGAHAFPEGRRTDRRGRCVVRRHLAEQGTAHTAACRPTLAAMQYIIVMIRILISKSTAKQRNGSAQQEDGSVTLGAGNRQGVRHNVSIRKGEGVGAEKLPKWGTFGKAPTLLAFLTNANNTANLHHHISKTQSNET